MYLEDDVLRGYHAEPRARNGIPYVNALPV